MNYNCIKNMTIPKKITPDHLKDTIVEIRFDSVSSLDLMPGIALALLTPLGFTYTPVQEQSFDLGVGQGQQISIEGGIGFFVKDNVRIQFIRNVIAFNCIEGKYLGWNDYYKIIKDVIQLFSSKGFIKSFNRVAIRYISEFESTDILDKIKGRFDLEETSVGLSLQNSVVRLAKEDGNIKIFVTLTNGVKKISQVEGHDIETTSFFDVNVFENLAPNSDFSSLEKSLENVHLKQKESFFETINEDFKKSLRPEY